MSKTKTGVVKIGPLTFDIVEIDNLMSEDRRRILNGYINFDRCEIEIDASLHPQLKRCVLWHEIVHGLLSNAGWEDHDEKVALILGHGIPQVLLDNPGLVSPALQNAKSPEDKVITVRPDAFNHSPSYTRDNGSKK